MKDGPEVTAVDLDSVFALNVVCGDDECGIMQNKFVAITMYSSNASFANLICPKSRIKHAVNS
jgi:hypothetical protein